LSLACLAVQRLWRGCVGRAEADRRWLEPKAVRIQRAVRGIIARRSMGQAGGERTYMVTKIQRLWRGVFARMVRNVRLFDRETVARERVVAELASEGTYALELFKLKERLLKKMHFEEKEAVYLERVSELNKSIKALEQSYVTLMTQRRQISPRAISQGWREELELNISDHREDMTKSKLALLFKNLLPLAALREKHDAAVTELQEAKRSVDNFSEWRELEVIEGIERENRWHHEREAISKRQKVASERRKWAVEWFTPAGKPDKLRRPGRPWDKRAYAGEDRLTFCGGTADLLAFNEGVEKLREGSDESLLRVMGQVQTQNFLNEVQGMDTLLKPLVRPLQQSQHAKPLWEEKAERQAEWQGHQDRGHGWVPHYEELEKYKAESAPPADPLRPPRWPSYPSPRDLEAWDDAALEERKAWRAQQEEEAAEALRAKLERVKPHRRPTTADREAGYDSRMAAYGPPPEDPDPGIMGGHATSDLEAMAREKERRAERLATEERRAQEQRQPRNRKTRRYRPAVSRIPWQLLDELEAEKHVLKQQKAVAMLKDSK